MAAEFEFVDDIQKPFKNKKLKPFLIIGVVAVVAIVLLQKANTSTTTTAYQGTYASNTGATTEVSNMLEDYKQSFDNTLSNQTASNTEQMESYLSQLNAMFDANMDAFDYQYQQKLEEYEKLLAQMGGSTSSGGAAGGVSSGSAAVLGGGSVQQAQSGGSSGGYVSSGGAPIIPEWRESGSNAAEDNGGTGFITFGWVQHVMGQDEGTGTSLSDLSNRAEGSYYYENADGTVHNSPIKTIESQHSTSSYTSKYDGSQVSSSLTETIITREDGTRVVTYTPNKNK